MQCLKNVLKNIAIIYIRYFWSYDLKVGDKGLNKIHTEIIILVYILLARVRYII
jgi:hypothetical protein